MTWEGHEIQGVGYCMHLIKGDNEDSQEELCAEGPCAEELCAPGAS